MSEIICCNCHKVTKMKNAVGVSRQPYCKPCFKQVWNNNHEKYHEANKYI